MAAGMEGRVRCTGRTRATEGRRPWIWGKSLSKGPGTRSGVWPHHLPFDIQGECLNKNLVGLW